MVHFLLFAFGTVIGSFLNVVALRWDKGNFGGRSACQTCGKKLSWYELVPLASFVFQRGKCRGCGSRISWQYPAVEILTGLMFATIFDFELSVLQNALVLAVFCIYIVILIYDIEHKIIPNKLSYSAIALSLVYVFAAEQWSLVDFMAGPLIFAFFGSIWFFSGGRAMGFGDAKLGASVGFLLGAAQGFSAIVLAFWIGAAASLIYIFLNRYGFLKNGRELTMKSEIPFAPFIILGAWASLALGFDIFYVG